MNPQENSESMVYHFPSLGLLKSRRYNSIDEREIKENAIRIQQTLLGVGIKEQISDISVLLSMDDFEERVEDMI